MISPQRKKLITSLLSARNFYQIADLARKLDTSLSTIRRDLNELEKQGIVKRTHGGVMFLGEKNSLPIFSDRKSAMEPQKEAIGKKAAQLVEDGETVIIDGGTTPYQVAVHLQDKNIQIVTNSIPVANLFADSHNVQVITTGGTLYPGTGVLLGPYAETTLKNIRAEKAFIGVSGMTTEGLYNSNALVVNTEKLMIEAAAETFLVTDHSKFNRQSLAFLCDYSHIAGLITDSISPQDNLYSTLQQNSVNITLSE